MRFLSEFERARAKVAGLTNPLSSSSALICFGGDETSSSEFTSVIAFLIGFNSPPSFSNRLYGSPNFSIVLEDSIGVLSPFDLKSGRLITAIVAPWRWPISWNLVSAKSSESSISIRLVVASGSLLSTIVARSRISREAIKSISVR